MSDTTYLCPACLAELPADYPYDHVAIDAALNNNRKVVLTEPEQAEAIRLGMQRGLSLARCAVQLRISYQRAKDITGLGNTRPAKQERFDTLVARMWAAGYTAHGISMRTGQNRAAVQRSIERQHLSGQGAAA